MSHQDAPPKKLRKLAQILKNRHLRDIQQHAEVHERNRELDREREEELREASAASSRAGERAKRTNPVWSEKLQEIRDRNTGRTRMASERWNRFAGTSDGGGRGL